MLNAQSSSGTQVEKSVSVRQPTTTLLPIRPIFKRPPKTNSRDAVSRTVDDGRPGVQPRDSCIGKHPVEFPGPKRNKLMPEPVCRGQASEPSVRWCGTLTPPSWVLSWPPCSAALPSLWGAQSRRVQMVWSTGYEVSLVRRSRLRGVVPGRCGR